MFKRKVKTTIEAHDQQFASSIITTNTKSPKPFSSDSPLVSPLNAIATSTQINLSLPSTQTSKDKPRSKRRIIPGSDDEDVNVSEKRPTTSQRKIAVTKKYFEQVLEKSGFVFENDGNPHLLKQEQAVIIKNVKLALERHLNYPKNVEDFCSEFDEYCQDESNFKQALAQTKTSDDCVGACGISQDSLIRILLSVDCLQPKISMFLMGKIVDFSFSDSPTSDAVGWVRVILRQLQFLSVIVDGKGLYEQLFSILETSSGNIQRELIFSLPYIIGDDQHGEAAVQLSQLLETNFSLTPVLLEALSSLSLEPGLRSRLCDQALSYLASAPHQFLPPLVSFLVAEAAPTDLPNVVTRLRAELDLTPLPGSSEEAANCAALIVANLRTALVASPPLVKAWLKAIQNIMTASEHRPLDVVVLIVVHAAVMGTCTKQVEGIFKTRARDGFFQDALVEKTFADMVQVLTEYLPTVLHIASALLQSPEPAVVHHASTWFKQCMICLEGYRCQAVVSELLLHIGTGTAAVVQSALTVLSELGRDHLERLQRHSLLLLGLLDKVSDLDLSLVRQVMDLLCRLAYTPAGSSESVLQDDISMLVRKQLTSSSDIMRRKGVVGAVMAVKHIAVSQGGSTVSDNSMGSSSQDSYLSEKAKQARDLLELVLTSVKSSNEAVGLFYDELSSMISSNQTLDETLEMWIQDTMINNFQDSYVVDEVCVKDNTDVCVSWALDTDIEEAICVNISPLAVQEQKASHHWVSSAPPLCAMHALFRLLRLVKQRLDRGSLEAIDALLGCALVMPPSNAVDQFPSLSLSEQRLALDCAFHAVNWFRETINAFATQQDESLKLKVLSRLTLIVQLQQTVAKWLPVLPDHCPPKVTFYAAIKLPATEKLRSKPSLKKKASKKGLKKGNKRKAPDDSMAAPTPAPQNDAEDEEASGEEIETASHPNVDLTLYRGFFRELDLDVFVVLRWDLNLHPPLQTESLPSKLELTPTILLFLLEDYVSKLEHLLPTSVKRICHLQSVRTSVGFSNLSEVRPLTFATGSAKLLPDLCLKLEACAEYCQKLLASNDGMYDGPFMFVKGSSEVKECFGLLLRAIGGLLSWTEFHSSKQASLLKECLQVLASRRSSKPCTAPLKELSISSLHYLKLYTDRTLHISGAVSLVRATEAVASFCDTDPLARKTVVEMCRTFLSRSWMTLKGVPERGAVYNHQVENLISTYLNNTTNLLMEVSELGAWVTEQAKGLTRTDSALETFPAISKLNFHLLYRHMCSSLSRGVSQQLDHSDSMSDQFEVWTQAIATLFELVSIAKVQGSRANLTSLLKEAKVLLKLFLNRGMPVCELLLSTQPEEVIAELKRLQQSTRFLNNLCIHSKVNKDNALAAHVPLVRQTLETLVFRVKGMLVANGCSDAFWMGNLKNKNLQGEEILSQNTTLSEAQEEEEETDDVVEDEPSGMDLDNDEGSDTHSEVY